VNVITADEEQVMVTIAGSEESLRGMGTEPGKTRIIHALNYRERIVGLARGGKGRPVGLVWAGLGGEGLSAWAGAEGLVGMGRRGQDRLVESRGQHVHYQG
jgi:hypothetical protein